MNPAVLHLNHGLAEAPSREVLIADLARYELLDPLVKAQAEAQFVSA